MKKETLTQILGSIALVGFIGFTLVGDKYFQKEAPKSNLSNDVQYSRVYTTEELQKLCGNHSLTTQPYYSSEE